MPPPISKCPWLVYTAPGWKIHAFILYQPFFHKLCVPGYHFETLRGVASFFLQAFAPQLPALTGRHLDVGEMSSWQWEEGALALLLGLGCFHEVPLALPGQWCPDGVSCYPRLWLGTVSSPLGTWAPWASAASSLQPCLSWSPCHPLARCFSHLAAVSPISHCAHVETWRSLPEMIPNTEDKNQGGIKCSNGESPATYPYLTCILNRCHVYSSFSNKPSLSAFCAPGTALRTWAPHSTTHTHQASINM